MIGGDREFQREFGIVAEFCILYSVGGEEREEETSDLKTRLLTADVVSDDGIDVVKRT